MHLAAAHMEASMLLGYFHLEALRAIDSGDYEMASTFNRLAQPCIDRQKRDITWPYANGPLGAPRMPRTVKVDEEREVELTYFTDLVRSFLKADEAEPEASAWEKLEQAGHASGPEIIRKRGRSPADVFREETLWRKQWRDAGEQINADPAEPDQTMMEDAA